MTYFFAQLLAFNNVWQHFMTDLCRVIFIEWQTGFDMSPLLVQFAIERRSIVSYWMWIKYCLKMYFPFRIVSSSVFYDRLISWPWFQCKFYEDFDLCVVQPGVHPGECWPFVGGQGYLVVQLSAEITVTEVSIEHIPESMSPTGRIDSAPKDFSILVSGLCEFRFWAVFVVAVHPGEL
jgi:Sad1 / UNC-like C-terminal